MANVLPENEKKKLLRREWERFALVGGLVLCAGATVASLALVPALLSVRIAHAALRTAAEEVRAGVEGDQAIQGRTQALLDVLTPLTTSTTSPRAIMTVALLAKPAGVSITDINFEGGAKGSLVLSGISNNRQAVNAYRDALQAQGTFGSVVVPVSALVGTQDGRFTVTLSSFK